MGFHHLLHDKKYVQTYGWGKIVSYLKKQMDQWSIQKLSENGYRDFKIAYMPVIMNIAPEGTNNNDLAAHARVTKQAMSKVVKELQAKGYVSAKVDHNDKRSTIFILTGRGKDFVKCARESVNGLMNDYRKEFGKKNFEDLLDRLVEVIAYNEKRLND